MAILRSLLCGATLALLPSLAFAADATADLDDSDGNAVGSVSFTSTPSGIVIVEVTVENLPAGDHAIHLHQVGDCSASDFSSAGDHIALGMDHGVMAAAGPHPGDLPNLHVGESGTLTVTYFNDRVSLAEDDATTLFDEDGSAVIIHSGADDYETQPSGDSGDPIACGVIEREQ